MKLINYNYGDAMNGKGLPYDSTWYRGKIVMTVEEWNRVRSYLTKSPKVWNSEVLKNDMQHTIPVADGFRAAVRTTATALIVRHFAPVNAKRFKQQNYFIHVITKN